MIDMMNNYLYLITFIKDSAVGEMYVNLPNTDVFIEESDYDNLTREYKTDEEFKESCNSILRGNFPNLDCMILQIKRII